MARVYQTFHRNEASIIQDSYCCAGCWNRILCGHDQDGDFMDCGTDDCNLPGLVSAKWVKYRMQQSAVEWIETKQVLSESLEWRNFINKQSGLTVRENLKELGF